MKKSKLNYLVALLATIIGYSTSHANENPVLPKDQNIKEFNANDLDSVQDLIRKNILIKKDNELSLNDSLKKAGLVQYLEHRNSTNCGDGGGF